MRRLLWVGDAGCPSGFAKATHSILEVLRHQFDVTVLGINYRGDPHGYPYPIYAAAPGGDAMGVGRLVWMCDLVKPDVIIIQNDSWNLQAYVQQLRLFKEYEGVPIVAIVAVDGNNFQRTWLDGLAHVIFWTQFALDEARASGFNGLATVIPLGVDTSVFAPMPKVEARELRGIGKANNAFIVGNVNRNQPRKRWDLTIKYFADWALSNTILDAYLFLHVAPTGDMGIQIQQLAAYYGVLERLILVQPPTFYGVPDEMLAATYNCFDVLVSTTQGEGFGLTALEAMACGIPCVLPKWSALGDWARPAAWMVSCSTTTIGPPYVNVIGGVPDQTSFINALDTLYNDKHTRAEYAERGLALAREARFSWDHIGQRYAWVLAQLLAACSSPSGAWLGEALASQEKPSLQAANG